MVRTYVTCVEASSVVYIQVCLNRDPGVRMGPQWDGVEFLHCNGINRVINFKNCFLKNSNENRSIMFKLFCI